MKVGAKKAKTKPPQVLQKRKGKLPSAICLNEATELGTYENTAEISLQDIKPLANFKDELSTLLQKSISPLSSPKVAPIAEDTNHIVVYDYADPRFDEDPNSNQNHELYETLEPAYEDTMIQKAKSIHITSSNPPKQVRTRQQNLFFSTTKTKGTAISTSAMADQPQLPWRNGETLLSSIK